MEVKFLSAYISKSFVQPSLKFHTANCDTQNGMMWEFGADQTDSQGVIYYVCLRFTEFGETQLKSARFSLRRPSKT